MRVDSVVVNLPVPEAPAQVLAERQGSSGNALTRKV
jgi:hypothetical protein